VRSDDHGGRHRESRGQRSRADAPAGVRIALAGQANRCLNFDDAYRTNENWFVLLKAIEVPD
jgi:hypothetical protein